MKPDDPINDLTRSVSEGQPVDWGKAESGLEGADDQASVRALRDLARIAEYHRRLQRSPLGAEGPLRDSGAVAGTTRSAARPEQWGDLTLLERASAGASGEVWRAWDAWLQREVALKFLLTLEGPAPEDASDSPLLEEARALARVRHPGVVAVHGIAGHDGRVGMWMELLRGRTLASEIERRGSLPPEEVTRIGLDLCRALQAVEAAGLVHRDIKPANIVLEADGRVVLTDFGLGRRRADLRPGASGSSGTPFFMSPEILAGEPATPRSDLYALGVTLRWALTGSPPFQARTLDELKVEAAAGPSTSLASERPDAPPVLAAAIERAMAPQAKERYGSAALLAEALDQVLGGIGADDARGRRGARRLAVIAGLAVAVGAVAVLALHFLDRQIPQRSVRFSVTAPPTLTLFPDAELLAVSPDGSLLAFAAMESTGTQRLWVRPMASLLARPLEGTEGVYAPFWSPDSRDLGFFSGGELKRISMSGGPPEILCSAPDARGASWGKNGVIVFAPMAAGPLCRISAEGGDVTEILRPDSTLQETALRWPQFLPDGKHFLFVSLPPREGNFDVYAAALGSRERRHVLRAGAAPLCAGGSGLILASNGRLMAQRFDYRRLKPLGEPVALGPAMSSDASVGQPLASVSMNGVLAQMTASLANTQLVWMDRAGKQGGTVEAPAGRYEKMFFSPDGRRLLAERRSSPTTVDLWMIDLERGLATRFSQGSQSRMGGKPIWSPDGSRIVFSSNREGTTNVYQRLANGAGEEELLFRTSGQFNEVNSWSPDGRFLVVEQADPVTGWDLWLLPLEGERQPVPYLRTRFNETGATVSPDGRWLAYCSDATGRPEVYVRPFLEPGGEHPITSAGGFHVLWSRDGDELLVLNQNWDHTVWSVPVSTVPTFEAGAPRLLFRSRHDGLWLTSAPEGDRFLASQPAQTAEPTTITVDLNWPAQLGR